METSRELVVARRNPVEERWLSAVSKGMVVVALSVGSRKKASIFSVEEEKWEKRWYLPPGENQTEKSVARAARVETKTGISDLSAIDTALMVMELQVLNIKNRLRDETQAKPKAKDYGLLGLEKFTFGTSDEGIVSVPNITLGYARHIPSRLRLESGIFGLSYLNTLTYHIGNKFSYCIGSIYDVDYKYNQLILGEGAKIQERPRERKTEMEVKEAGSSLDALISSFNTRISELQQLVIARNMYPASSISDLLAIDAALKGMELQVLNIKNRLRDETQAIPKAKKLIEAALKQQKKLETISDSVPSCMPERITNLNLDANKCVQREEYKQDLGFEALKLGEPGPAPKEKKGRASPPMWYVTADELNSVPPYMKQRLTLDKVNAAIGDMAAYAEANSQLITAPRKKLAEKDLDRALELKDIAATDAVKGKHFFLEADIKGPALKLDNTGRALLTVLRHLDCSHILVTRHEGTLCVYFMHLNTNYHRSVVVNLLWAIWQARNAVLFQRKSINCEVIGYKVRSLCSNLPTAPPKFYKQIRLHWEAPGRVFVKLNSDGASRGYPGSAGIGGVVRDEYGHFIAAFAGHIGIHTAKLWAIREGLRLCVSLNVRNLIIESDSRFALSCFCREVKGPVEHQILCSDILKRLTGFERVIIVKSMVALIVLLKLDRVVLSCNDVNVDVP
ncbi:hypothetical protein BUALT_Bualt01G0206500 [Buddleja alternifolia]|uniref:SKA complex subunit 1 homolog n=1 Tax=Buddleja alternifolia TaxID=168488 RepID=A0AAV6YH95_9LAMI|nr:hypothetical protein BUALT_Bualt01G0206500 [Buddleja alternifolia]